MQKAPTEPARCCLSVFSEDFDFMETAHSATRFYVAPVADVVGETSDFMTSSLSLQNIQGEWD